MADEPARGPLLGPTVLVIAGVVIAAAPIYFADLLARIGWQSPAVGILLGALVALCGIGVYLLPTLSREFGVVAMALSIVSLFGALGGMLVGMLLGIVGGGLCVAWKPTS
ncbi:MAG: DUF6114 domain-containing protein [Haloarculaceae archaeon]